MKNNWAIVVLVIVFITAIVFISQLTNALWSEKDLRPSITGLNDFRYHFVMIGRTTEEIYWKQVHTGAGNVAGLENAALEYYGTRFLNLKELERYFDMAILSNVDGILISVPNEPTFHSLIDEATAKKIPLVILSTDIESGKKTSFVGINTYDLGLQTGLTLARSVNGKCQVAVLVNSNYSAASYKRYLQGIQTAIQSAPNINIRLVLNSKGESISAEEQTQSLLKNYPEIGAIVCSDASDTLGVAKVVVDLNRVTQVAIIGAGLTTEIIPYIKRGVIRGVLADDPRQLGAQAMLALLRLKQGKSIQETYYMQLILVNTQNVDRISQQFNLPEPKSID
jgi:ribose transport system substrate-binding protein